MFSTTAVPEVMETMMPPNFPADQLSQPRYKMVVERNVFITMRDGVRVACDIYRPLTDEKCPAIYAATPYQKAFAHLPATPAFHMVEYNKIEWFVERGYVYVLQDQRGTGESEGDFTFLSEKEQLDFYDCIEWIAHQPWCTGKVGMIGESFLSWSQWFAAQTQPPHLCTIVPFDGGADMYRDVAYHGGILSVGFPSVWYTWELRANYHLGYGPNFVKKNPDCCKFDFAWNVLNHPTFDEFWQVRCCDFSKVKVPVFSIGEWHKSGLHLRGNIRGFEELQVPKKLLVCHGELDGDEMAVFSSLQLRQQMLRWYDHWLKGNDTGMMNEPNVCLYVKGKNAYRYEQEWPLARTRYVNFYLSGEKSGAVDSLNDGKLSPIPPATGPISVSYSYPQQDWTNFGGPGSAIFERGHLYSYRKILTFTSDPFERETEICGSTVLTLFVSTRQQFPDFKEAKFLVRLWDQFPDAEQDANLPLKGILLTQGRLKGCYAFDKDEKLSKCYRPYYTHETPREIEEGKIYKYEIEVLPTANLFGRGHRLRLEIANYDSNAFDHGGHYYGLSLGEDTLYFDAEHQSVLTLPIAHVEP